MRHILYVTILGVGFFGVSSLAVGADFKTSAYMGPGKAQTTHAAPLKNGNVLILPVQHTGKMNKYTRKLRVSDLQRQLNQRQSAGLVIDGIWGPKTSFAVAEFQRANELPITGQVDAVTFDIISGNL